ncbi:zinc-binding dehydrogenase [Micromonospora sp. URMC 105]|uniref:zinc-binding dehydrogenase n=1 Tax=Micromonospora sp. URMC 105 TaxID=3423413 RepID=UPI003F1B9E71
MQASTSSPADADRARPGGEILREAATLADAGALRPRLDPRRFTLDTVMDAHALVAGATSDGKVVVDLDG